jgi:hypothetical protein
MGKLKATAEADGVEAHAMTPNGGSGPTVGIGPTVGGMTDIGSSSEPFSTGEGSH